MTAISAGTLPRERAPAPAVPAGPVLRELGGLDDLELLAIFRSMPRSSARRAAACDVLVARHAGLVRSCARRYRRGGEPDGDLMQVGYLGLLKAISGFDPAAGDSLGAYAQVTVTGELKRHFRDKAWPVHVARSAQELALEVRAATEQLSQDLSRDLAEPDLSSYLDVTPAELRNAQRAEMALLPRSLDAPLGAGGDARTVADRLGAEDPAIERMLGMNAVAAHWGELPARERRVLAMRFWGDMTQAQIGAQLGLSQMHVSRLLSRALGYLRARVLGLPEQPPGTSPALR
jgi:RNA polymerase sigma-B factor